MTGPAPTRRWISPPPTRSARCRPTRRGGSRRTSPRRRRRSARSPSTARSPRCSRSAARTPRRAPRCATGCCRGSAEARRARSPAPRRPAPRAVAGALARARGEPAPGGRHGRLPGSTRSRLTRAETELGLRGAHAGPDAAALDEREATLNSILEPGVQLFQLTASGDPDPGIQLFWNRQQHRAIVHGYRLKAVPAGRAYQLWFIKDGRPVPSVTFKPEPDGHARVEGIPVPEGGASARRPSPSSRRAAPPSRPRPSSWWDRCRSPDRDGGRLPDGARAVAARAAVRGADVAPRRSNGRDRERARRVRRVARHRAGLAPRRHRPAADRDRGPPGAR